MASGGVPRVSWGVVRAHLLAELGRARSRSEGLHSTLLGPTGRGKTHAALHLLDLYRYALVLAAKPRDPLLSSLCEEGYTVARSRRELNELPWTEDGQPLHPRVLYWPTFSPRRTLEEQTRLQAQAMRQALHWAYASGQWAVLIDEGLWFSRSLRLAADLEALWQKGRSQGVSLIVAAQRPAHMPLYAYSQARFFFLWATRDARDLERLAEISSGADRRLIERTLVRLDNAAHEFLFFDAESGMAGRVVAPPRNRASRHGTQTAAVAGR